MSLLQRSLYRLRRASRGRVVSWAALASLAAAVYFIQAGPGPAGPAAAPALTAVLKTNALHPVHIRQPGNPPLLPSGQTNWQGEPLFVSCGTCHATTRPNRDLHRSDQLTEFHLGLAYEHGNLTCLSCHNPANYDTLRRADGRSVDFPNVLDLCSQCHGPQARDYRRGSHGGMTGYWDLKRGPRFRNVCTDCHDPHDPRYPAVLPVFAPRDRFPPPASPPGAALSTDHVH